MCSILGEGVEKVSLQNSQLRRLPAYQNGTLATKLILNMEEDGREMYVSLEEAISCPPSLFSISSRAEKGKDNTNATKSAASGVSNVRKSVLYEWCDRCTIQSFMDTVLSLSLRKRQQSEHMQQQIQEQQQKQKQEQLKYLKQQKQQQFQQQNNPVNTMNSITSSFSENLQLKDTSKETASQSQSISGDVHLQDVSQRRPKVKKVMKGGVLVSMPCGTRQPTTGAGPFENSNNAEKNQLPLSNYKDMANNFGAGNILDDILARAKDSQGSCITSFTKTSQAEKRSEAVGDPCEMSLGHESDCSVSSGGFPATNTDFNPANNTPKYGKLFETSCGRPCLRMQRLGLISSESSSDNEILSSFDRIRSLQFHNDDVFTNMAETLEGESSKQAASTEITNEDEIHLPLKKLQEIFLAKERTNANIMPNEEQQNKDLFSEEHKVVIDMETSFKTINADENDKKRKEILDASSSSIETKGKRMKETEKASTASKTPQIKEQDTNIQSLIKTKRKGPCSINWKNINSGRVTRSMSHGSTGKSPPDTKTQGNRSAECFPRNTYEPGMEISENVPSLISMVSDEVLDVTVVEKEVLKKRGGRKKKKKNKPNEWFLRNKAKEKELKNNTKPPEYILPVCIYFRKGTCAKGSMCQFRHEKTKELCGYYAGSGECYKFQDGMCPNLHSEFPCKFFHTQKFCWNEDKCRFSHEPLTEEMRDVFDNYLLTIQQRNKQGDVKVLESSSSITEKSDTNEKFKEICSVDKTGGSLSSTIVTAPSNPVKQLPAANIFKYPVPTESSGKSVNSPKVKRLCSLSSYKPQILPSLTSTIKNLERSSSKHKIPSECNPEDSPQIKADETSYSNTKLQFLPGMFKER